MMLIEAHVGSGNACFARLGLYVSGSTFYTYLSAMYNYYTYSGEANTTSKGSLSAGVKYRC